MTKKTIIQIGIAVGGVAALYLIVKTVMGGTSSAAAPLVNQQLASTTPSPANVAAAAANPTVTAQGPLYAAYTPVGLAPIGTPSTEVLPTTISSTAPSIALASDFVSSDESFSFVKNS